MIPDPIGILQCPDCPEQFGFSAEGAQNYWDHWELNHQAPHAASAAPTITGTARIVKADGTVFEVPLTGSVI
jgi:hypothetical protein